MGHAGIVIGIEVSRLARNSSDWHRLLEICALSETLILDEDGVYDPNDFNDRLVLGLKGTMSEAELHYLKARMLGGRLAKAKRGELKTSLPVGFVYAEDGTVILDPDRQVQQAMRTFFDTFEKKRSAGGVLRSFREHEILFPSKVLTGANKGQLIWAPLLYTRAIQMLHNPHYAGIYSYGRIKTRRTPEGTAKYTHPPPDKWHAFIRDAHPAYISFERWEENQKIIASNAQSYGVDRRNGPPREGPALLQGLLLCGKCGCRMRVSYHERSHRLEGTYRCDRQTRNVGQSSCQSIGARVVDQTVAELVLRSFTPGSVELAFQIQHELRQRAEAVDLMRKQNLQRLDYEAAAARKRYMQVDPSNRLVADTLEADWNTKLRAVQDAQEDYKRQSETDERMLGEEEKKRIIELATDFPKLWNDAHTSCKDKKRIVRHLIEDVTVTKAADRSILMQVRFRGGATDSMQVDSSKSAVELFITSKETIGRIDALLDSYHDSGVAAVLNAEGRRGARGMAFSGPSIGHIRRRYGLRSFSDRLHAQKLLTINEIARKLDVSLNTAFVWAKKGILEAKLHPAKKFYLCTLNPDILRQRLTSEREGGRMTRALYDKMMNRLNEVQYELWFQPFGDFLRANAHWHVLPWKAIPRRGMDADRRGPRVGRRLRPRRTLPVPAHPRHPKAKARLSVAHSSSFSCPRVSSARISRQRCSASSPNAIYYFEFSVILPFEIHRRKLRRT
jgi:DNA invertase Pin-like site-specific DNA recombinase